MHEPPRHHAGPTEQKKAGKPSDNIHPPQLSLEGGEHLLAERLIEAEAIEEFGVFCRQLLTNGSIDVVHDVSPKLRFRAWRA